ncbi:hypothetical protein FOZ60_015881 [Perkinsus olseni]|uniref:Uncharacterized protein n=1 Tax=Perkinsus olseni TaxID=32597 RepID=A0A7J6N7Q3_PEROL|nr:hypothetical protein FOZ60_015881 [Perkinsus olseni]
MTTLAAEIKARLKEDRKEMQAMLREVNDMSSTNYAEASTSANMDRQFIESSARLLQQELSQSLERVLQSMQDAFNDNIRSLGPGSDRSGGTLEVKEELAMALAECLEVQRLERSRFAETIEYLSSEVDTRIKKEVELVEASRTCAERAVLQQHLERIRNVDAVDAHKAQLLQLVKDIGGSLEEANASNRKIDTAVNTIAKRLEETYKEQISGKGIDQWMVKLRQVAYSGEKLGRGEAPPRGSEAGELLARISLCPYLGCGKEPRARRNFFGASKWVSCTCSLHTVKYEPECQGTTSADTQDGDAEKLDQSSAPKPLTESLEGKHESLTGPGSGPKRSGCETGYHPSPRSLIPFCNASSISKCALSVGTLRATRIGWCDPPNGENVRIYVYAPLGSRCVKCNAGPGRLTINNASKVKLVFSVPWIYLTQGVTLKCKDCEAFFSSHHINYVRTSNVRRCMQ